jgi:hypothetical protein
MQKKHETGATASSWDIVATIITSGLDRLNSGSPIAKRHRLQKKIIDIERLYTP